MVTVFGIGSRQAAAVMQCFSNHGSIVRYLCNPSQNWMHLQFEHPYEALSALRENGALLEPNVMIGVRPLSAMHEAQVLKELGEQATVRQFQPASRSPLGIRSLNYDQESLFPQQSKGLKSRVMDFLMGA
eukprot:jgi/Astpho2/4012/Aster-x0187